MEEHPCPNCGLEELVAITYAYHKVLIDERFGPQFDQYDLGEQFALQCMHCGWQHDNPLMPGSGMNLARALSPELIELEEFEKELREQAKAKQRPRQMMDCSLECQSEHTRKKGCVLAEQAEH